MKKFLFLILFILCSTSFGQEVELKEYVTELTKQTRHTGTEGNNAAAKYLEDFCKDLDLNIKIQKFDNTQNIISWTKLNDEIIVVGAHYDSYKYVGADDNASGTAAVMYIAKIFANKNLNKTISFQFYSGEEQGMIGSSYYVKNPIEGKHVLMINLDMIGYLRTDYNYNPDYKDVINQLSEKYTFVDSIIIKGSASDHTPFINAGIPAIFIHTGNHSNYHRRTDTAEKLNYKGMSQITKFVIELLNEITENQNYKLY